MGNFLRVFIVTIISISLVACGGSDGGKRKRKGDSDGTKPEVEAVAAKKAEAKKRFGELRQFRQNEAKLTIGQIDGTAVPMTVEIFQGDRVSVSLSGNGKKNSIRKKALKSEDGVIVADARHIDQIGTGYPSFVYVFVMYPDDQDLGDLYVFAYTESEPAINLLGPIETAHETSVTAFNEELELYSEINVGYFEFMKLTLEFYKENPSASYAEFQAFVDGELEIEPLGQVGGGVTGSNPPSSGSELDIVSGSSQHSGASNGSKYCGPNCQANKGSVFGPHEYRTTNVDDKGRVVHHSNSPQPIQYIANPIQTIELPCDGCIIEDDRPRRGDWGGGVPDKSTPQGHRWEECLDDRVAKYKAWGGKGLPVYRRDVIDHYDSSGNAGCTKDIREEALRRAANGTLKDDNRYRSCVPEHMIDGGGFKYCRITQLNSSVGNSSSSPHQSNGSQYAGDENRGSSHGQGSNGNSSSATETRNDSTAGVKSAELHCGVSYGSTLEVYNSGVKYFVPNRRVCIKKPSLNFGTITKSKRITLLQTMPGVEKIRLGLHLDFSKSREGDVFIEDIPVEVIKKNDGTVRFSDPYDTFEIGLRTTFKVLVEAFYLNGEKAGEYVIGCQVDKLDYVCED